MALCVLAAGWKLDGSAPKDEASGYIEGLLGIVVDHRLRPESTEEAEIVRDRVNNMGNLHRLVSVNSKKRWFFFWSPMCFCDCR